MGNPSTDCAGKRNKYLLLSAIFIIALAWRVGLVLTAPLPEFKDAATYSWPAWNLVNGNGFSLDKQPPYHPTARRGPVYPLFLAAIYSFFGRNYLVVRLVQAFIGAMTCLLVYPFARRLFGQRVAMLSTVLCALSPPLIIYANHVLTEVLCTFLLIVLGITLFKAIASPEGRSAVLPGIALGVVTQCRPDFILFPAIVIPVFWLYDPNRKSALKKGGLFLLAFIVTLVPWTARNYWHFKELIPITASGGTLFVAASSRIDVHEIKKEVLQDRSQAAGAGAEGSGLSRGLRQIVSDPGFYLKSCFIRFTKLWEPRSWSDAINLTRSFHQIRAERDFAMLGMKAFFLLIDGLLIVGAVAGSLMAIRRWRSYALPLIFIIYISVFYSLIWARERYRVPVMPYTIMLAAYAYTVGWEKGRRWFQRTSPAG